AELLHRAGFWALAVAAGHEWTKRAMQEAAEKGVVLQRDGQIEFIEQGGGDCQESSASGLNLYLPYPMFASVKDKLLLPS
ncbi:MAG: hypothetical protein NZL98_00940, partial [Anaerolineales bacterium]|nr:hypothetical protein [Anaerolineales bacterium]